MNIKHAEIDIPTGQPFKNCKLDRKKYADILTDIVSSYSDGFVLALNNKWGTGKTTFVKMWEQDLKNNHYKTIYFNAWENDFEDNPLTALMGELKTLKPKKKDDFKKALGNAAILSKHILPVIAQAVANKYIDTKIIKDSVSVITKGVSEIFEMEVNEYINKKKNISEFKNNLKKYINDVSVDKPIIFIIDELDRCRPNYAVSILEQIKHFFSIPKIIFVLSIDKIQLGNAVKGVYGTDLINSDEYLRRFIDLEYSLPEPEPDIYCKYLYDYYKFEDFFESTERNKHRTLKEDAKNFLNISKLLFTNKNITLRQQEKIYALARVALLGLKPNEYLVPYLFIFLAYIKITDNIFYQKIKNKELEISELQEEYLTIIKKYINDETENELIKLEAILLEAYNKSINHNKKLYTIDDQTGSKKLLYDSKINKEMNSTILNYLENNFLGYVRLKIDYFLNKLELLENINREST